MCARVGHSQPASPPTLMSQPWTSHSLRLCDNSAPFFMDFQVQGLVWSKREKTEATQVLGEGIRDRSMHSAGHTDPAKKTPADEGTESSFKNMQDWWVFFLTFIFSQGQIKLAKSQQRGQSFVVPSNSTASQSWSPWLLWGFFLSLVFSNIMATYTVLPPLSSVCQNY